MSALCRYDNKDIYPLASVTGLVEWVDYLPVQLQATPNRLNSTDNNGALHASSVLASITGKVKWVDYIPVYVVARTVPWYVGPTGYIPYDDVTA